MMCICGHPEENHERGWGMCDAADIDGAPCRCVMFEMYEPELNDEDAVDEYPWRDDDDDN